VGDVAMSDAGFAEPPITASACFWSRHRLRAYRLSGIIGVVEGISPSMEEASQLGQPLANLRQRTWPLMRPGLPRVLIGL
jgi:hypothetical protein